MIDTWENEPRSSTREYFTWSAIIALAWIAYEITAQPAIGAAVACAKFGWEDVMAARWIMRFDPNRQRSRTCFWFYFASGLWRVSFAASGTMIGISILAAIIDRIAPVDSLLVMVLATLLEAFLGFWIVTLSTCAATAMAIRYQVKAWIDPAVHSARRKNFWPPQVWNKNVVSRLLITSMIHILITIIISPLILMPIMNNNWAQRHNTVAAVWLICMMVLGMFGAPVAILCLRDLAKRKIIAKSPKECWGTGQDWHQGESAQ